jgi:hypothetical protein
VAGIPSSTGYELFRGGYDQKRISVGHNSDDDAFLARGHPSANRNFIGYMFVSERMIVDDLVSLFVW